MGFCLRVVSFWFVWFFLASSAQIKTFGWNEPKMKECRWCPLPPSAGGSSRMSFKVFSTCVMRLPLSCVFFRCAPPSRGAPPPPLPWCPRGRVWCLLVKIWALNARAVFFLSYFVTAHEALASPVCLRALDNVCGTFRDTFQHRFSFSESFFLAVLLHFQCGVQIFDILFALLTSREAQPTAFTVHRRSLSSSFSFHHLKSC